MFLLLKFVQSITTEWMFAAMMSALPRPDRSGGDSLKAAIVRENPHNKQAGFQPQLQALIAACRASARPAQCRTLPYCPA
jgi:hypothetical protein